MNLVLLILAAAIAAGPGVGIIVFACAKYRRRRRCYAELRRQFGQDIREGAVLDVRYASERRYRRALKLFPWEMIGILVVRPDAIDAHLVSENRMRHARLSFFPQKHTIEWVGRDAARNGLLSWLAIGGPGEPRHYFTAETGATIRRSKQRGDALMEVIQESLQLGRCRRCDYLLWGNVTGVCPECGSTFSRPAAAYPPPADANRLAVAVSSSDADANASG